MRRTFIATALLAALSAGCGSQESGAGVASVTRGSSPPSASASATPTTTADPQEQGRKFAQCMREHGVPMEDPDPDGGGGFTSIGQNVDKNKVREAAEACRAFAPFKDRRELNPEEVEQLRQFAQCMRENGVDMPDPNPDGTLSGAGRNFNRDDPQFRKALDACGDKFRKPGAAK
ncbi:hypothetical protein ETD86_09550 [Nonomuraea turkmeniaca]|uniref:Lipoprotein n=1 Tax=Nonomuraea turkmeniaca TaxID=103838 RepID=A0A5S4FQI8_9ACTN|nr:hypothetical protein [Nonomuraea turkmeniaca]TMR22976.1 hypothetical protein ETD86_09550 [Nonomuraea turkmeniaca]